MAQWDILERLGIKGHFSMEGKYSQVQFQRVAQNSKPTGKIQKTQKRKSCKNQGVTDSHHGVNAFNGEASGRETINAIMAL